MPNSAPRRTRWRVLFAVALLSAWPLSLPAVAQTTATLPGVVIETLDIGSAPYRSGLRSGDVLFAWARVPVSGGVRARGRFASPFDLKAFELEEVPRGTHVLVVERAGRRLTLTNQPGPWTDMTSRPYFLGDALIRFEQGLEQVGQTYGGRPIDAGLLEGVLKVNGLHVERHDFDAGLRRWEELASHLSALGEHQAAAWLYWRISWELINAQKLPEAEQALQDSLTTLQPAACRTCEADLQSRFAHELVRTNQVEPAMPALERARASVESVLPDSPMLAAVLQENAVVKLSRSGDDVGAKKLAYATYERAIAIRSRVTPRAPERALLMTEYGFSKYTDFDGDSTGERLVTEAWALIRAVAPYSNEAVTVGENYAQVLQFHGENESLERLRRHLVRATERCTPKSRQVSLELTQLAGVLTTRGKLDEAEMAARRALDHATRIEAEFEAGGWKNGLIDRIFPLTALGDVAFARGDLAAAEDFYRQAIAAYQRRFKDRVGRGALGLGRVLEARGDLARAFDLYSRIGREISNSTIGTVNKLARMAVARGDFGVADERIGVAREYAERIMPNSIEHAEVVETLGIIARARGDRNAAMQYYREALAMLHKQAAGTLAEAAALQSLGDISRELGRDQEAEQALRQALDIRLRLAPGTRLEAETRYGLALVLRSRSDPRVESEFRLAMSALERQVRQVGTADDARAGASAQQSQIYREYVDWLLQQQRPQEAFQILERSRGRSFLTALAERDVRFSLDVPAALAKERSQAETEYDQLQAAIAALNPSREGEKLQQLLSQLHVVQASLDVIADRMRAAAPKAARIRYPQPMSVAEASASISTDTVVLSYAVGTERSFLFVLAPATPSPMRVLPLAATESQLRTDVTAFRRLIQQKRSGTEAEILTRGRALYDLLIRPAEAALEPARRVLVIADGPLLALPFCALVRSGDGNPGQFLVQWKPLHTALSVTAYSELQRQNRPLRASAGTIALFADPSYPPVPGRTGAGGKRDGNQDATADDSNPTGATPAPDARWDDWTVEGAADAVFDPAVRTETERGARLTPLPGSRQEALAIGRLFGPNARIYLGPDATEERATSIGSSARIVHFATHGLINDRLPLNSALALSIPPTNETRSANGLLQAWEIYDRMRLDADLVTLSACETALGREFRGDGLLGLTRAFLYAGARSVLASQWRVSDRATAELMEHFYRHFRAGESKDEALRSAQLAMIGSNGASHPYYWAAFQLHGAWK